MHRAQPMFALLIFAAACGGGGDAAAPGENQSPTAAFGSRCTGLTCTFLNFSKDTDGSIQSWDWTFGDGGTASVATPAHVYSSVSSFDVTLTVTDDRGATAAVTRTVKTTTPTTTLVNFTLEQAAGFKITLTSTATCEAHGNTFRVTSPVNGTLTTDACYDTPGKELVFAGPYAAGTVINAEIVAPPLAGLPDAHITGSYPTWQVGFEDGVDHDYDDVVITVTALP